MDVMQTTKWFGTLALAVLVTAAGCDGADDVDRDEDAPDASEQMMLPQQEMDPETMERVMEIQQIQAQLEPIQQQALQDEQLAGQLEALQTRIEAAMREENPELIDRMHELQNEMAAAQAAGDEERMQGLMMEAQGIQQQVQGVQAAVLERPAIREQVNEFDAAHRAAMIEVDPEAERLLERFDELVASLSP